MKERLITPKELARELGVSVSTIGRWRREGIITPARTTVGGQARYRLSEVLREIER